MESPSQDFSTETHTVNFVVQHGPTQMSTPNNSRTAKFLALISSVLSTHVFQSFGRFVSALRSDTGGVGIYWEVHYEARSDDEMSHVDVGTISGSRHFLKSPLSGRMRWLS